MKRLRMPLEGYKVLDIATVVAAPFAAALLGDYGAEVIKVELPGGGDTLRAMGPYKDGHSLWFASMARNKKSITLDLRQPKGKELLLRLVEVSDVVCENFRPGTLEGWGLGYEVLQAANPNIVMLRVSGYGQTGPYRQKYGFGTSCNAMSGLTYISGDPDRPPQSPPFSLADYVAGLFGALGAVTALLHRKNGGPGQQVDVGLYEGLFRLLEYLPAEYKLLGRVRERSGGRAGSAAPVGIYRAGDGAWACITCSTDRTWQRLADTMGRAELKTDPRFDTNPHRVANATELDRLVQDWMSDLTGAQVVEQCDEGGVPASLVYTIADICADPQYAARENIVEVEHPAIGRMPVPGVVPKFSETPGTVRSAAPAIGQHNDEIYGGLLGLSAEEMATLQAERII